MKYFFSLSWLLCLLLIQPLVTNANTVTSCKNALPQNVVFEENTLKTNRPIFTESYFLIYGSSHKPEADSLDTAQKRRKAKWSKFLGIGSIVGLVIPYVGILSLPAAIVAIVMGKQVRKDTNDPKARKDANVGIITGWVTNGLFILAALVLIVFIGLAIIFLSGLD